MKYRFIIALFLLPFISQAQDYKVTLGTQNVDATTLRIVPQWTMPKADATYYNKRFGTDELMRELQQVVNKIKSRIADEQDNDLRRAQKFLTPQEKQRILDAEQLYRDTVGTFERSQTQGSLMTPEMLNDTCANDPFFTEKPEQFAANVGKALSNRLDFLGAPEVVPDGFRLETNSGFPIPSWEEAWPFFVIIGFVVTVLFIAAVL